MSEMTDILSALEQGDPRAAEQLLPLVYAELRWLAARRLARENPGQTLEPTALVHEAFLRLVGSGPPAKVPEEGAAGASERVEWHGRKHFFAAAAEAMRRILVENARRKKRQRHGGDRQRVQLHDNLAGAHAPEELLAIDDALTRLAAKDAAAAEVVKLHFFGGLSMEEVAETLGISRASAYRHWTYARAWLGSTFGAADAGPAS
jgi:RNA polymerase sigma factor (sigma-70 family)